MFIFTFSLSTLRPPDFFQNCKDGLSFHHQCLRWGLYCSLLAPPLIPKSWAQCIFYGGVCVDNVEKTSHHWYIFCSVGRKEFLSYNGFNGLLLVFFQHILFLSKTLFGDYIHIWNASLLMMLDLIHFIATKLSHLILSHEDSGDRQNKRILS